MELCIKCGNPTAGDVTGSLYCVVCGELQPQETASLPGESPVFRGILADVPVLPGELISSSSNKLVSVQTLYGCKVSTKGRARGV